MRISQFGPLPIVDTAQPCEYPEGMSVVVQIRNLPDETRRKLKARAALAGMSISEYLLQEIESSREVPSHEEFLKRLRRRSSFEPSEPIADIIAAERESR